MDRQREWLACDRPNWRLIPWTRTTLTIPMKC
ncbi:rCG25425 [Rattus norvegicus]|uniref:RCG25425 n=1 Tax=Rattus norvegicus TaxID=10116 RepID=A6I1S8_RAT|nr:rCG25425 [Rattus norvegicus]